MIGIPIATGDGLSTFVIDRSAAITRVLTLEELFASFRSLLVVVTLAVFETVPGAVGVARIVIAAVAPFASVPTLQVMFWVPVQVPVVVVTVANESTVGSGSLTVTPLRRPGRCS